ncbi:MAG: hypothetical protein QM820_39215 [Minicystis sp.]
MKNIIRLCACLSLGLFAVACVGSPSSSEPGSPESGDEEVGEAEQALPSSYTITTYYKEAAKINEVGYCISPSICTGSTTSCSGQKTVYYTRVTEACF